MRFEGPPKPIPEQITKIEQQESEKVKLSPEEQLKNLKSEAPGTILSNALDVFKNIKENLKQELDLRTEETVRQILESGSPEEIKKFQEFYNLTPEQITLFSDFAKLRKRTHEQIEKELKQREAENPNPTEEELNMGAYKEVIEPQVRDAVLNLRRKGYTTSGSGFFGMYGWDKKGLPNRKVEEGFQTIDLTAEQLKDFQFPNELKSDLKTKGINVVVSPNAIELHFDKYLELNQIKEAWDAISEILPDLGHPAEPANSPQANYFRKRF